jgi:tRNA 2-selenouridine synthase
MNPRPASAAATVSDIADYDTVIDVRSPAEFALDHVPGAINCPVLDNEERHIVGTLYVQVSAFEARKVGGAMVARHIAEHLDTRFRDRPRDWKPLLYCWRGGERSRSFTTWLRLVGWDAQALQGGYKAFRRHVIAQIEERAPRLRLQVLSGPTGSAKTRVLQALAKRGEQVLDLEQLAAHRGSVLGAMPDEAQPSQKGFETRLATALAGFDMSRPVWAESESRKIGRVALPTCLLERLRASPTLELIAPLSARLDHLLRDYAHLEDDREALAVQLGLLADLHPRATIERWQTWARQGELPVLFEQLMLQHYDPLYSRSQRRGTPAAARIDSATLDAAAIDAIASRLVQAMQHADAPAALAAAR